MRKKKGKEGAEIRGQHLPKKKKKKRVGRGKRRGGPATNMKTPRDYSRKSPVGGSCAY